MGKIWRFAGFSLLAIVSSSATAEDFRYVCNENPGVGCAINNTVNMAALATNVASDVGAVAGDAIFIIKTNTVGTRTTEWVREYSVNSAPVTSSSDLTDYGVGQDTYDGNSIAPNSTMIMGTWNVWGAWERFSGKVNVWNCSGRLNCWGGV